MNTKTIIGVILIGGGLAYLYFKRNKNASVRATPVTKIPVTQETPKPANNVAVAAKPADPVMRSVIVPPLPVKYADGTPVPKSVLENEEFIKAWNKFYQNTIFAPGDPRNNVTPSGGMLIGDGNGGLYDPNA